MPTTVEKTDTSSMYVRAGQTDVCMMNFTITTQADIKLAGITPIIGQALENYGQANDWGSIQPLVICYDGVENGGDYDWNHDCIWLENAGSPNSQYGPGDTLLNGTAPPIGTNPITSAGCYYGCKAYYWIKIKTYDALNGGAWNESSDSIIFEGTDNNSAYMDQLRAVTFILNSSSNGTQTDISSLSIWRETGSHAGFQSMEDTRLKTVVYTPGTGSWNLADLNADINTQATFYATVNISGSADHHKTLRFWIPIKTDTGTPGQYDLGDQGVFLAGSNDTGNFLNSNYLITDVYAPETHVNPITGYWKTDSPIPISATATDNCSGVGSVSLYYRFSNDNITWEPPVFFAMSTTPWIRPDAVSWEFDFPDGNGYYGFISRGTDNISNTELLRSTNDTICGYDTTHPETTLIIPANNRGYHTLTNVTGTGQDTFSGLDLVTITIYNTTNGRYWNDTAWSTLIAPLPVVGATTWYKASELPTWSNGNTYIINSTSIDFAGNLQTTIQSHRFTYDTETPTGTISIPMKDTWYNAVTNISGTASDTGGSGLSAVRISIYNSTGETYYNGTIWSAAFSWITVIGTNPWFYTMVPTWTNNTTYCINLSVKDNADNYNNGSANAEFKIDTGTPLSQVTPIIGYWKTSSPLLLSYTTNEKGNGSGLKNITLFYYFSTTNTTFSGPFIFDIDTTPWSPTPFSFTFPNASGFYRFYTRAADNATNIETAPLENDTICGYDTVNPTAIILLPEDNASYTTGAAIDMNITGTAYNVRGINLVNISIYNATDGTYWTGSTWQPGVTNLTTNLSGGTPTTEWWFENHSFFPTWSTNTVYTIIARVRDTAGNWNTSAATTTFRYDTNGPSTTIIAPVSLTWYNMLANITGSATDTGGSGIGRVNLTIYNATSSKYWNGAGWGTSAINLTAMGTTSWYYTTVPVWTNNTIYTINASSTDNAHNIGTQTSSTFSVDTFAPLSEVNAISPYWQTSTLTISVTAPPHVGSGLKNVSLYYYFSVDNTSFADPILFGVNSTPWNGASWSFSFPNSNGYYRFMSRAADNATNIEAIPETNDTICGYDAEPPSSSVNPITPYWRTSSPLPVTATASNGVSGVKNVTLYSRFSPDNSSWGGWTVVGTDTESPWSWFITFDNGSGYYEFYSRAKDNASNTEIAPVNAEARCGYDSVSPTSSVNAILPLWKNTSPVTVTATTNDATSGVKNVTLYYRYSPTNTSWEGWMNFGVDIMVPWSWDVPFVNGSGYYEFYSIAHDNATNAETSSGSADALCGYDDTPPTCTIAYNRSLIYFRAGAALKIYANFTETLSGMNETSIFIRIITGGTGSLANASMSKTDAAHWYLDWNVPAGSDNDGTFTIQIYGQDNAANILVPYPTTNASKKIDNTGPTCSIAYNQSATYFKAGDQLRIFANFTETGSGMDQNSVKIRIETQGNGGLANHSMNRTDLTHYTYTWVIPSGSDNDGVFSVWVYAKDNLSNLLNPFPTQDSIKSIDNTNPTSTVTAIAGYWKTTSPLILSYTASDPGSGSGLKNCTLYVRFSPDNISWDGWVASAVDTDPWTTPQWTVLFSNGSGHYQFISIASDNASNRQPIPASPDAGCGFDDTAPAVAITVPVNNSYLALLNQISGTCSDVGSGVHSVNITIYNGTAHQYWNETSLAWEPGLRWISATLEAGYTTWSYDASAVTWQDSHFYWVNATVQDNTTKTTSIHQCNFTIITKGPSCTIEYNNRQIYYHSGDILRIYANFTTPLGINEDTVRFNITTANGASWNESLGDPNITRIDNTHWYDDFLIPQNTQEVTYDGVISVYLFAQDTFSQYLSPYPTSNTSKIIDNTRPIVSIAYNSTLIYFNSSPRLKIFANFAENGSGLNQTSLYLLLESPGGTINTSLLKTNPLHYTYNWTVPSSPNDGVLLVQIFAQDNASNPLEPYPTIDATKTLDVTPPESTVNSISGYWKKTPITITAIATDATSGVNHVSLFYYTSSDNSSWSGPWDFGVNQTGEYSWTFDFPNDTGYYRFYSIAIDNAMNSESPPPANDTSCGYDTTPPRSTVQPFSPYWQTSGSIIVTTTATDDLSGLRNVTIFWRYSVDNSSWEEWQSITRISPPLTITLNSPDEGYYQFYSIARDMATNTESAPGSPDAICGYDSVPPSVTITLPIDFGSYYTLPQIYGTADDETSGVRQVTLTLYNTTAHTYWDATATRWEPTVHWLTATGTTSWSYDTTTVTWGTTENYMINVTAIDNALLTSEPRHHHFTIDTMPPVISSVSSGAPLTTSATITWMTNENATSLVQYGKTTSYGSWSNSSLLTLSHTRMLGGLTENTIYHYRVLSADAVGNLATSTDHTFTTASSQGPYYGGGTTLTPPVADADGPYAGYVNTSLNLSGLKSTDIDGTIIGYRWDWTNDGTYDTDWSSNGTITHVYPLVGIYTVKLQVKDNDNLTGVDTTTVIIKNKPGIVASHTALSMIQTLFGITLTTPFYANDTNDDGIVDSFTDPNQRLILVRFVDITGHPSFLLSIDNDNIPEFFWDTTNNTITPVTNTPATLGNVSLNTTAREIIIEINIQKTGWIYLTFDDAYPLTIYPDFTFTLKTSEGRTIPSDHLWRENGTISALDDASLLYLAVYQYFTLPDSFQEPNGAIFPPTFTPLSGTIFTNSQPTILIIYLEPVTITLAMLNNQNIIGQITSANHKTFTYTPTTGLVNDSYQLSITVRNQNGNTLTSSTDFFVSVPQPATPWLLYLSIIIIVLIVVIILYILRRNLLI